MKFKKIDLPEDDSIDEGEDFSTMTKFNDRKKQRYQEDFDNQRYQKPWSSKRFDSEQRPQGRSESRLYNTGSRFDANERQSNLWKNNSRGQDDDIDDLDDLESDLKKFSGSRDFDSRKDFGSRRFEDRSRGRDRSFTSESPYQMRKSRNLKLKPDEEV